MLFIDGINLMEFVYGDVFKFKRSQTFSVNSCLNENVINEKIEVESIRLNRLSMAIQVNVIRNIGKEWHKCVDSGSKSMSLRIKREKEKTKRASNKNTV